MVTKPSGHKGQSEDKPPNDISQVPREGPGCFNCSPALGTVNQHCAVVTADAVMTQPSKERNYTRNEADNYLGNTDKLH